MALDAALFAKLITIVPRHDGYRFMAIASAFALRASADAVAPPILRAGQAKIRKTRRFEITCSGLAKLGRIMCPT
jgi:hypothetical protein